MIWKAMSDCCVLLQSRSSGDQDGVGSGTAVPDWHLLVLQHHQDNGRYELDRALTTTVHFD